MFFTHNTQYSLLLLIHVQVQCDLAITSSTCVNVYSLNCLDLFLKLGMATGRVRVRFFHTRTRSAGQDTRPGPSPFTKRIFFRGPLSPARFGPKSWPNQKKKKRNHWSPKKELKNKRLLFFAPFLFPLQHHLCADPLPINWVCKVTQHRNSKSF